MHYFLGLEFWQRPGNIFLSQGEYVVKLLEIFGMIVWKSLSTSMEMNFKKLCGDVAWPNLANPSEYHKLIGALMFPVNTQLNICFVVKTLNQFMTESLHSDWVVAKHIMRYLHGMINFGLRYTSRDVRLHEYVDIDSVGKIVDMKSTSRCCSSLGSNIISW